MNRYNQPYSDQSDPLFQKGEMIQGNQLNLVHHSINNERLPASAGLPSAAGLYRSNSAGGGTLNGIAEDMKFLTGLMLNKKKKSISVPTLMKTSIKTKEPTQKRTLMTYKEPKFNTINPIALYKLNPKKKKKKKLNGSSHQEFTKKSKSLPNIVEGKPGHPLVHGNWNLSDPTLRKQPSTIQLDDPFQQQFHRLSIDSTATVKKKNVTVEEGKSEEYLLFTMLRSRVLNLNVQAKLMEEEKWKRRRSLTHLGKDSVQTFEI